MRFLDAGIEVVVLDDLSTGVRANLPATLPFYEGDVADRELVTRIVREHRVEGALHFAGSIVVSESVADPAKYYRNNTSRGLEFVDALLAAGVRHLLFSSTAAVYGAPERVPIAETAPAPADQPLRLVQAVLRAAAARTLRQRTGWRTPSCAISTWRAPTPRAARARARRSRRTSSRSPSQTATGQRDGMSVYGTDYPTRDGTCVRDFIHVTDLAEAHVAAYELLRQGGGDYTFNCGNGRGYTVREVIQAVEAAAGRPLRLVFEGRRAGDPPELIADPSLLFQHVAWRPRYSLGDMVETALEWERRQRR